MPGNAFRVNHGLGKVSNPLFATSEFKQDAKRSTPGVHNQRKAPTADCINAPVIHHGTFAHDKILPTVHIYIYMLYVTSCKMEALLNSMPDRSRAFLSVQLGSTESTSKALVTVGRQGCDAYLSWCRIKSTANDDAATTAVAIHARIAESLRGSLAYVATDPIESPVVE